MDEPLKYCVSFVENSNDCMGLFTLDGRAVFINEKSRNLVGFSENDDVSKIGIEDFFNTTTRVQLTDVGLPTLFKKGKWEGELQVKHLFTGDCLDVNVNLFFINDSETNQPVYLCMRQRDISGQKKTGELIFEEDQILDAFMDNLPDPIYVKDKSSRFLKANKAMAQWLGHDDPAEIVGKWDYDFFSDEYAMKACAAERQIIETGEPQKNVIELETWPDKDDTWIRTSKIPLYNSKNNCVGIIGISSDITELVMAEKKVIEASKQTERLLASLSSILIGIGPNEEITQWNAAAEQTFGIKAEIVVGKGFLNCGIKWDWLEVLEHISRSLENEKPTNLNDIRFTREDDTEGFLDIAINRIVGENVEHAGYLLIATEITERKNLESQLSNAQKLESIGQLAAGIAHEINTPIQYVGDNAHFLKEAFERVSDALKKSFELLKVTKENSINPALVDEIESIIEDNQMEYMLDEIPSAIQETLGGVERVANIVRAMKEFSHPGTEEKTLTDINKALDSTITVSSNEWKYVAEMEKDFTPSIPLVPCLPGELNQVFLNLIVNAAHAIADAAKQGNEGMGKIKVSTALKEASVEIRISDTGTGIPPEIRKKVFDPFFTTKEVGKGTGQGLAISHNVVKEKHGGELTFETEIGKGTTFIVRLPVNDSKE